MTTAATPSRLATPRLSPLAAQGPVSVQPAVSPSPGPPPPPSASPSPASSAASPATTPPVVAHPAGRVHRPSAPSTLLSKPAGSPSPSVRRRTSDGMRSAAVGGGGSPLASSSRPPRPAVTTTATDAPAPSAARSPALVARSGSLSGAPGTPQTTHRRSTSVFASPSTPSTARAPTPPTPTTTTTTAINAAAVAAPRPSPPSPPTTKAGSPVRVLPSAFASDYASTGMRRLGSGSSGKLPAGAASASASVGEYDADNDDDAQTVSRLSRTDGGGSGTMGLWAGPDGDDGRTDDGTRASFWAGTEADDVEVDEELEDALDHVRLVASAKATSLKRLLEQSQTSFSTQLHALQTELQQAKHELAVLARARAAQAASLARARATGPTSGTGVGVGEGLGEGEEGFDEGRVKTLMKSLGGAQRAALMRVVLDSCMPGDVSRMIAALEHYRKTAFDVLTHLPEELGAEILSYLPVRELVGMALVSPKWRALVQTPDLWRYHSLVLTSSDPVPPPAPSDPSLWFETYKSLHFRERNWAAGLAQDIRVLRGHESFVTALALHGSTLLTGSYDETIRVWDLASGTCRMVLKAKAISCLEFCPAAQVFAVGFHDVGRVQVWSSVTWQPLQTLAGHLHGIRAVALDDHHLVSAGADKALVVWDWRAGTKITRFGQQTTVNVGLQLVSEDKVVSVTLDGIIRCFSVSRREMVAQYKLSELAPLDRALSARLQHVGGGHLGSGQLAWMAAKGVHLTCATKNLIVHLEWEMGDEFVPDPVVSSGAGTLSASSSSGTLASTNGPTTPRSRVSSVLPAKKPAGAHLSPSLGQHSLGPRARASSTFGPSGANGGARASLSPVIGKGLPSGGLAVGVGAGQRRTSAQPNVKGRMQRQPLLTRPPRIVSVVDSPDVSIGAVDPRKKRVVTSTRFSSRSGAKRNLYVSTYQPTPRPDDDPHISPTLSTSDLPRTEPPPTAVSLLPSVLRGACAAHPELGTSEKGPMSLELDHEKIVVGCQDGTVYVASMVGHQYASSPPTQ